MARTTTTTRTRKRASARATTVRVDDRGARAVLRNLGELVEVDVGVLGPAAARSHRGAGTKTTAQIMTYHEFGGRGGNPPERKPIRGYVDRSLQRIAAVIRGQARRVARGKVTFRWVGDQVGAWIAGGIQDSFHKLKPLKPASIKRKGGKKTTPLINTGQLRRSITWRTRFGGRETTG